MLETIEDGGCIQGGCEQVVSKGLRDCASRVSQLNLVVAKLSPTELANWKLVPK